MARNRENRPELDYDLLVERHERFRSRHPQKKPGRPSDSVAPQAGTAPAQAQPAAEAANVQAPAQEAEVQATATAQAANAAAVEAPAQDVDFAAVVDAVAQDIPASAAEEAAEPADAPDDYDYDEEYDEDVEDDGEEEAVDPNPFGSILSFLSRSRDAIGSRLHRKRADEN